jgi:peptidoglycan/xylan/chitin deacetylase (PgdA/CDA1 family)
MAKPMIKIYAVLLISLALCLLLLPSGLGRTAAWASDASVRIRLLGNQTAKAAENITGQAHVIFVFDDGWDSQYIYGYETLKKYEYCGCVAVIPSAVGTQGYMTYGELADLYSDGWDILNHTYNHVLLTGLPAEEQKKQICKARKWLISRGLSRGADIVVFPAGDYDTSILQTLAANDFSAGRSLKSLWSVKAACNLEDVEICNISPGMDFEYVKNAIDKAILAKSTVILLVHKIEPVTEDTYKQLPLENFSESWIMSMNVRINSLSLHNATACFAVMLFNNYGSSL